MAIFTIFEREKKNFPVYFDNTFENTIAVKYLKIIQDQFWMENYFICIVFVI